MTAPQTPLLGGPPAADREQLGQVVRRVWMAWAVEQADAKLSWQVPWQALPEPEREVDRRIGETVWALAIERYEQQVAAVLREYRQRVRGPLLVPASQTAQRDRSRARFALELLDALRADLLGGPQTPTAAQEAQHQLERDRGC